METPDLVRRFVHRYQHQPTAIVRAPGRVNLIGDHIDYLGLPVLPLALQQSIWLALCPRPDGRIRAASADPRFAPAEFDAASRIPPSAAGSWDNYLKAGCSSALAAAGERTGAGFDALVGGDLPPAAGLSSSSALVVAAALATLHAASLPWEVLALAETLARGERYVGTEGGGMDQAVCLCALAGHALRIDFAPLRVRPIAVPSGWRLLVASSLRESRKSAQARAAYNDRSRAARQALAETLPGVGPQQLIELLDREPHALDAIAAERARLRHVLTECRRVLAAERLLAAGDIDGFGRLMTESHASLRDDYQVSTPELDVLVQLALAGGAAGARLTGAGFGGCAIALCTAQSADSVRQRLEAGFYADAATAASDAVFVAEPAGGASIQDLS